MEMRGEPGSSAGGPCIAVDLGLCASVSRQRLRGRRLGFGLPLRIFGGGVVGATFGDGVGWVLVLLIIEDAPSVVDGEEILFLPGEFG